MTAFRIGWMRMTALRFERKWKVFSGHGLRFEPWLDALAEQGGCK
jgi:hypothetical protein